MTLHILGGKLTPVVHDGSSTDAVYGVDASGAYLGVVPRAKAADVATGPAPKSGNWRWAGGTWAAYRTREEKSAAIEADRDQTISGGVVWNGRKWPADQVMQQHIASCLLAISEGVVYQDATFGIRAKDKVVYQLNRAELRELAGKMITLVQATYAASWSAKDAIGS